MKVKVIKSSTQVFVLMVAITILSLTEIITQTFKCSPNFHFVLLKAVLNWAEHSVREQLCLLEMFKLAVWFLIDVFDLGEQLCSRPMGRHSDVRNVGSAGYGSMLLIG